jgi:hypothetical protein
LLGVGGFTCCGRGFARFRGLSRDCGWNGARCGGLRGGFAPFGGLRRGLGWDGWGRRLHRGTGGFVCPGGVSGALRRERRERR